jgi:hypothetical protein
LGIIYKLTAALHMLCASGPTSFLLAGTQAAGMLVRSLTNRSSGYSRVSPDALNGANRCFIPRLFVVHTYRLP